MNYSNINHLVFDMGGVLIEINWHRQVSKLLGMDVPFEEIHAIWGNSKAATDFEHGRTDFDQFTHDFIAEHNLNISKDEFEQEFKDIIVGDFQGAEELLAELQPKYTLSMLSNTNSKHWAILEQNSGVLKYLANPFTSIYFEAMKPDVKIYQRLVEELQCEPNEILFFDDGKMNVDAARAFGINAEQVFGPDDIRQVLETNGLL
jgi:putative hydrolase of the HAD superfamily